MKVVVAIVIVMAGCGDKTIAMQSMTVPTGAGSPTTTAAVSSSARAWYM
jgi:hypothetical protein